MKKTICSLFVFASLIATAAPKPKGGPTFSFDSCEPGAQGACALIGVYTFSGQGYATKSDYKIYAISSTGATFEIPAFVDDDGNLSAEGFGVAGAGTWTFTVSSLKHNGSRAKDLASDTAVFENAPPPEC